MLLRTDYLVAALATAVTARLLMALSKTARFYIRLSLYLGCICIAATYGPPVALGLVFLGRRLDANSVIIWSFYHLIKLVLGVKIEIVGGGQYLDATRPAVLMMNHQSILDIALIGRLIPRGTTLLAKRSLMYTPVGPYLSLSGCLYLDRKDTTSSIAALQTVGRTMKRHLLQLWIFPEGTRHSRSRRLNEKVDWESELLPFKKGGFHLAIENSLPIIPMVAENYSEIFSWKDRVFEPGIIKILVLEPIHTEGMFPGEAAELASRTRRIMLDALEKL